MNDDTKKLLIVDDDPEWQKILMENMQSRGFTCKVTSTQIEFRKYFEEWKPDSVLIDMQVPVQAGEKPTSCISLIEQIIENNQEIHIAVVSNHADLNDLQNLQPHIDKGRIYYEEKNLLLRDN